MSQLFLLFISKLLIVTLMRIQCYKIRYEVQANLGLKGSLPPSHKPPRKNSISHPFFFDSQTQPVTPSPLIGPYLKTPQCIASTHVTVPFSLLSRAALMRVSCTDRFCQASVVTERKCKLGTSTALFMQRSSRLTRERVFGQRQGSHIKTLSQLLPGILKPVLKCLMQAEY